MTVLLSAAGNPPGVKHALNGVGFNVGAPRLPLVEPDAGGRRAHHGRSAATADRPRVAVAVCSRHFVIGSTP